METIIFKLAGTLVCSTAFYTMHAIVCNCVMH